MTKTLLFALLFATPAVADPTWTAVRPVFPVIAPAGTWCEVEIHGPPGQKPLLQLPGQSCALEETSPGVYRARAQAVSGAWQVESDVLGSVQLVDAPLGVFEVKRSEAVFRCGPSSDYDRYTPVASGTRFAVLGREGDYYHVSPPDGWIRSAEGELLPASTSLGGPQLSGISLSEERHEIILQTGSPCAWQIHEKPEQRLLQVDLPGVPMAMLETAYAQNAREIRCLRLQPEAASTRVEIPLQHRLWGYSTSSEQGQMTLRITPAPDIDRRHPLNGLRVTVDAGHGGADEGTVGLELHVKEKDLNLQVAQALQRELQGYGAVVTMTRSDDRQLTPDEAPADVELQARVDVAERSGADLFISVHHNARPQVSEGRVSHGTHVYYYQPHSCELARSIAAPLARAIGEPDFRHLWRSFAVIRQTRIPAVLVECNFLSNPELEQGMLRESDYPEKAAAGIRQGLENFLREDM